MKRISAILVALILIAAVAVLPASAGVSENPRVVDKADILTDDQEAALTAKLKEYSDKLNYDLVFLTEPNLHNESYTYDGTIKGYADEYYITNNYAENGVIVMITLDNGDGGRDIQIIAFDECQKRLPAEEREAIIDEVYSDLKSSNYYEALDTIADELNDKLPIKLKWYMLPLAILIGFVIAMVIMMAIKGKLTTVAMQRGAASYVRPGSMHVTASRDTYLYSTVSKTARQSSSSSGNSGTSSGGSSRSSGSGRSF